MGRVKSEQYLSEAEVDCGQEKYVATLSLGKREGLAAVSALALSFILPRNSSLPKLCLFNRATCLPCPFCGLTRSFISIGHGDLRIATLHHPLGVPAYLAMAAIALRTLSVGRLRASLTRERLFSVAALLLVAWAFKLIAIPRKYW